jgi:hypothetical protein
MRFFYVLAAAVHNAESDGKEWIVSCTLHLSWRYTLKQPVFSLPIHVLTIAFADVSSVSPEQRLTIPR